MTDTILFDLDGTLLPMDMKAFMKAYFTELTKKCARHGYTDHEKVTAAVWDGTKAMVKNDGADTNENVFWRVFAGHLGPDTLALKPELERFYEEEFDLTRSATLPNPGAAGLVRGLRARGFTLALATNPLFPMRAMRTRLAWIDLTPEDFDLVSCYEEFHSAKPSPAYFTEVLARLGQAPEQCVMVGNDADEDTAAAALGTGFYLVTDHLLNESGRDISGFKQGSFGQCAEYLNSLSL